MKKQLKSTDENDIQENGEVAPAPELQSWYSPSLGKRVFAETHGEALKKVQEERDPK